MNTYSHITVLSNWLNSYERYTRTYTKKNNPQSTYPNEFYLLQEEELAIGVAKAKKLLSKIDHPDDQIIRIITSLTDEDIVKNARNGLGWVYPSSTIPLKSVMVLIDDSWVETTVEELTASAYKMDDLALDYNEMDTLTLSFLPVAMACQAKCLFCFSDSSISSEKKKRIADFEDLEYWCERAAKANAKRFVITGGGEPTIIPFEELITSIKIAKQYFDKIVVITNGIFLSKLSEEERLERMTLLKEAGLTTLSLSYHAYDPITLQKIMGIDTQAHKILETYSKHHKTSNLPNVRIICVLQQGGIDSVEQINKFVSFAAQYNVEQLTLKELYVASTQESLYSKTKENLYSTSHQIPLSIVTDYIDTVNHIQIGALPWGSPIYKVTLGTGQTIDIAAYTEPSVGWERANRIARSWNYMADKKCYGSLEDSTTEIRK